MAAATHQPRPSPHPPLAHDARGIPIAIPEGTIAWRVRRQTAGRPKVVLGADRQPLRLPLDTTADDLLDLCGAGTFRLDAVDDGGQLIDFVTTVSVGCVDDASAENEPNAPVLVGGRGGTSTDLRFALETTAHLARAQSEALRSIANAQADWIKGLASAKAFPRNGMWLRPEPAVPVSTVESDEDEDDDADEDSDDASDDASRAADPLHGVNTMLGHIAGIAQHVSPLASMMMPKRDVPESPRNAAPEEPAIADAPARDATASALHLVAILDKLSPEARRITRGLLAGKNDKARELALVLEGLTVEAAIAELEHLATTVAGDRQARATARNASATQGTKPASGGTDLGAFLAAVRERLSPAEVGRVIGLVGSLAPAELDTIKATVAPMTPDQAAAWVREQLAARANGSAEGDSDAGR